jgi:hypothetical protein
MGALIGYDDRGVWASNRERDAFLDWFADHRCQKGDVTWEFCKSEGNRWTGCGVELAELLGTQTFTVTDAECEAAAQAYWPAVGKLLRIVADITNNRWQHSASSTEAVNWRDQ